MKHDYLNQVKKSFDHTTRRSDLITGLCMYIRDDIEKLRGQNPPVPDCLVLDADLERLMDRVLNGTTRYNRWEKQLTDLFGYYEANVCDYNWDQAFDDASKLIDIIEKFDIDQQVTEIYSEDELVLANLLDVIYNDLQYLRKDKQRLIHDLDTLKELYKEIRDGGFNLPETQKMVGEITTAQMKAQLEEFNEAEQLVDEIASIISYDWF